MSDFNVARRLKKEESMTYQIDRRQFVENGPALAAAAAIARINAAALYEALKRDAARVPLAKAA
jgi:hypothetical protein